MSLTAPESIQGFRFAAAAAGLKKRGGLDVAIAVADAPVTTATVTTTNLVKAAPVVLTDERAKKGKAQALLVNAGCANACTGAPGMKAAKDTTKALGKALGIDEALVLPSSTGVIGQLLPADKVTKAIPGLVASLSPDAWDAFSQAILTTDRGPKVAAARVKIDGKTVRLLGIAKGAGMIHPNMATTLAFVFSDAKLSAPFAKKLLRAATDQTFNVASVDGDTSTNDTIAWMSSGASKVAIDPKEGTGMVKLLDGLVDVLGSLADLIVADGEGAEHLVRFAVSGARSVEDAKTIARTIATSNLVKTALHGKDPNWGRIVAAAGRAGVPFDPNKVELRIGDVAIVKKGLFLGMEAEKKAAEVMKTPEFAVHLKLGAGPLQATYTTCDFGHEYVRINADYRS